MTALSGVSGGGGGATSSTNAFRTMTSEEFTKVMFTELQNQDPLSPSDTKALLEQISLIRSIESDAGLQESLEAVAKQNEVTSASGFVGKFVTGSTSSGAEVAGYVDSVSLTAEGPIMNLSSGHRVGLGDVSEIVDPSLLKEAGDNESPTVSRPIPDQIATVNEAWSFAFDRSTFSDEDGAEGLTYVATLSDGSGLPDWLAFDPSTRTLNGTPGSGDEGVLNVRITAVDSFNRRGSDVFELRVQGGGAG